VELVRQAFRARCSTGRRDPCDYSPPAWQADKSGHPAAAGEKRDIPQHRKANMVLGCEAPGPATDRRARFALEVLKEADRPELFLRLFKEVRGEARLA